MEVPIDPSSDEWLHAFATDFAELIRESDQWFTVDEARKDLQKTRSEILEEAGYPMSLVIRAK